MRRLATGLCITVAAAIAACASTANDERDELLANLTRGHLEAQAFCAKGCVVEPYPGGLGFTRLADWWRTYGEAICAPPEADVDETRRGL